MLMTLANGKVAVCLEVILLAIGCLALRLTFTQGGYNFRSISKSALAVTKTLMGDPPDRLHSTSPSEVATSAVRRVMMIQAQYWKCMFPKGAENKGVWSERLHGKHHRQIDDICLPNRCDPTIPSQTSLRQLQTHVTLHFPERNIEIIREPSSSQVRQPN